jgi:hypothetical protein
LLQDLEHLLTSACREIRTEGGGRNRHNGSYERSGFSGLFDGCGFRPFRQELYIFLALRSARLTHIVVMAVTHSIPFISALPSRAEQGSAQLDFTENAGQSRNWNDRILGIARIL